MKTQLHIQDNTCPQPPAIREFAAEQLEPLIHKNPRIASVRLKVRKLPSRSINDVYRVSAVATGRCFRTSYTARSVTVRAALKSIRAKCEAAPRPPAIMTHKV
ncbi:hypothetical protein SH580_14700 [Coraliomargarita algicola]|uniref:Uncharacterized protein n=1 Tax=Coraliomargarita algicola TaxID=3092156 RepID=A0ABZ0RH01_9BACT|nr:hypothetical protein [Coraliomargarita sp. J2-16]WPJ94681.1 hypothetical protein SH580_14700 [Coraliomargarita sp. J2-16]